MIQLERGDEAGLGPDEPVRARPGGREPSTRRRIVAAISPAIFASSFDLGAARGREPKASRREPALVSAARAADLVILDDLGQEPHDASRSIATVIFERHAKMRPTIFTTWASDEQLIEMYGAGIARRIVSGALTIDLGDGA